MMNLTEFLFFAVPIGSLVFLVYAICRYRDLKNQEQHQPGSISPEQLRLWKTLRLIAWLIVGGFVVSIIALVILMFFAIAYM